jgi:hypothetical protein
LEIRIIITRRLLLLLLLSLGCNLNADVIDPYTAAQGPFTVGPGEKIADEDAVVSSSSVLGGFRFGAPGVDDEAEVGSAATMAITGEVFTCTVSFPSEGNSLNNGGCSTGYDRGDGSAFDLSGSTQFLFDVQDVQGGMSIGVTLVDTNMNVSIGRVENVTTGQNSISFDEMLPPPAFGADLSIIDNVAMAIVNQTGMQGEVTLGEFSTDGPISVGPTEPSIQMNAGLNDAWFNPVTDGQGFFINVFPDIGYVSLSWFTYETERPADDVTANLGEPGHRWLMALGPISGNQAVMDIAITSGGVFDTSTPVTEVNDGNILLTFSDCRNATVEYDITSIDRQGVVPIKRVVGDNIALCELLEEQNAAQQINIGQKSGDMNTLSSDAPVITADPQPLDEMNAGLNDAWYYPVTNGQGFFVNVFPDIGYVSMSWFTYETERPADDVTANLGEPGHRWLMALGPISGNQAVMDIAITSGGVFDTPTPVTEVNDGTIILTFPDCENGTVEYDITSIDRQGIVPIRRVVSDNIALCEILNTE